MAEPTPGASSRSDALTLVERFAVRLGRAANETSCGKRGQEMFLRSVAYPWMRASMSRRMFVEGLDELIAMAPARGVLLVSNHRSFFDLYAIMLAIWMGPVGWARQLYFPVRANFFYDRLLGVLVNFIVGGGVMYPPVFRQRERAQRNRDALQLMQSFLQQPNSLLGMHPEGTRGKGDDPYQLLPAQPGVGEIALTAKPVIIPVFINGLSNNFFGEIRRNYARGVRRENPLICVFGRPLDCEDLFAMTPRLALYKVASDRFRLEIMALGEREKRLRAACLAAEIGDDHQGWLDNRGRGLFYASPR